MKLITRIHKSRITKGIAFLLAFNMLGEIIWPTAAMALTSGPSQPEVQSFEPVETTDMVNLFTGDFNYNIPLIYLPGPNGGYPINLAYHGGITMDQEASWVGLGWNINPGALVRNVRGFADDYDGDELISKVDMKPNITVGLNYGNNLEFVGGDPDVFFNVSPRYNNYKGFGLGFGMSFPLGSKEKFNMGMSLDSENGMGMNVSYSFENQSDKSKRYALGLSYNNKGLGTSFSRSKTITREEEVDWVIPAGVFGFKTTQTGTFTKTSSEGMSSGNSGLGFSANTHAPSIGMTTKTEHVSVSIKFGDGAALYANQSFGGFHNIQSIRYPLTDVQESNSVYGFEHLENAELKSVMDFSRENDAMITPMSPNLPAPILTYDTYTVLGQGMAGSFRPYRTDVGRTYDPKRYSYVQGGSIAFDVGTLHLGIGGTVTNGYSVQRPWDYKNDWAQDGLFDFKDEAELTGVEGYKYSDRERTYYRMHGDKSTMDIDELVFIGGYKAIETDSDWEVFDELDKLVVPDGIKPDRYLNTIGSPGTDLEKRIARNILIHKFKNYELSGLYNNADASTITAHDDEDLVDDIPETSIFYYNWSDGETWLPSTTAPSDPTKFLDRSTRNSNDVSKQNGAYKILNQDGQYYVYGLPAYNNKETQAIFSVDQSQVQIPYAPNDYPNPHPLGERAAYLTEIDEEFGDIKYKYNGTHEYLNKTTKAPYAHSYLLTSILGADYVDVDDNGPSENDLGYWVKFDYVKYCDDYKWRAPFKGANYNPGALSTNADDMGSYLYGEKEIWYVSRIETKSHILVFDFEERNDNYEAAAEINKIISANGGRGTKTGLLINKISLYLKSDYTLNYANAIPLQEVHFEYDYSLCGSVYNNDGSSTALPECVLNNNNGGKLTLKRVWITNQGSEKGSTRPYEFSYYNEPLSTEGPFFYNENQYDRWGNYTNEQDVFKNKYLPYVNQNESQTNSNQNASAWCLKTIHLPTGGDIQMTYEMDDYGFVQTEQATQMYPITKVNDQTTPNNSLYDFNANNDSDMDNPTARRVYFELSTPLPSGQTDTWYAEKIYNDYVRGLIIDDKGDRNLYFKTFTELRSGDDQTYDHVSGYVPIENYEDDNVWTLPHTVGEVTNYYYKYGVQPGSDGGSGYTKGFITIKQHIRRLNQGNGNLEPVYEKRYHPFSIAAWEHMRLNEPLLLTTPAFVDIDNSVSSNDGAKAELVSSLLGFIPQTIQMFTGVWWHCYKNEHAQIIDLNDGRSVIRLCTPDYTKRGGGQRVKQISVSDNWDSFTTSGESQTTGVVYDYSMVEDINGTNTTVSSGVAQYEPMHGGDENPLHFPKFFPINVPFNTDQHTFTEFPINEQLYPAPVVGYRKVTVRSLNTKNQMDIASTSLPDGIGTTGITEYEFYTAKEFPVICEETSITKSKLNLPIPIPFIGTFERQKLKAAQGYKIEVNDMHGQLKAIRKYGLNDDYEKEDFYTSSVEYTYQTKPYYLNISKKYKKLVSQLYNVVETISEDNNSGTPITENRLIGVEYDFWTDQRQNKSHTVIEGGDFNVDNVAPPFILLSFWPQFSTVKSDFKSHVTNKSIFKSGVLKEVTTYDGLSKVTTKNEVYDKETGRPIIVSVNNEFEDRIYNYSHPAHWEYDRMGGAYKNIDLKFEGKFVTYREGVYGLDEQYIFEASEPVIQQLVSGDEILANFETTVGGQTVTKWLRGTFLKPSNLSSTNGVIYVQKGASQTNANEALNNTITCNFKIIRSGRRNHVFADAGTLVTKDMPVSTSNYNATRYIDVENFSIADPIHTTATSNISLNYINNVLNASAVVFKDEWENNATDDNKNPFITGEAGIWRPYKSYVYVGDRNAGPDPYITSVKTDIRHNGEMDNVYLFNWQVQNFENYVPQWQWLKEISKYSPETYELENIDRLGIRTAALYAYYGSLVVAVGANAGYHEIGCEDFERYPTTGTVDMIEISLDDNLNFGNSFSTSPNPSAQVDRTYRILNGTTAANGTFYITIETTESIPNGSEVQLALQTSDFSNGGKADSYLFEGITISASGTFNGYTTLTVKNKYKFTGITPNLSLLGTDKFITGRVTIAKTKSAPFTGATGNYSYINTKAHTGKQSMKFQNQITFPQCKLDLIEEKTYVLSAWVSRDDIRKINYDGFEFDVKEYNGSTYTSISNSASLTKSKVIEGWQKFEIEFTPTSSDNTIAIVLTSKISGVPIDSYIDDIRISPKTGGIVTYVYDSYNYRLKATLDNNNFATFYYYDEEGNLFQVKRETAKGIQTVTENRGHTNIQ